MIIMKIIHSISNYGPFAGPMFTSRENNWLSYLGVEDIFVSGMRTGWWSRTIFILLTSGWLPCIKGALVAAHVHYGIYKRANICLSSRSIEVLNEPKTQTHDPFKVICNDNWTLGRKLSISGEIAIFWWWRDIYQLLKNGYYKTISRV